MAKRDGQAGGTAAARRTTAEAGVGLREPQVGTGCRATARWPSRPDHRKARKSSQDSEARRQQWLHETRDGYRHQALLRLALVALGFGWSYEQYEAEILAHPVSCKLDGQSPGWLRRYIWDKAEKKFYKPLSSTNTRPNRQWRRHGAGVVRRWLDRALLQVPAGQPREPSDLLALFASWAERFGPKFYLCQGLMKLWLDLPESAWRGLRALLNSLLAHGLIIEHDREGPPKRQATYWDLVLDLRSLYPTHQTV